MISDDNITKFQQLYKKHFGIKLNREEALRKGIKLYRSIELTYKPMTEEEFKELLY